MGRTFEFRLQPLLETRTRVEDAARRELLACRAEIDQCESRLRRLSAHRGVDVVALQLRDAYLRRLGELGASLERVRRRLQAASQERRVIETLKQRRLHAFAAWEARREELELDEANARRHERDARKRVVS